MIANPFKLGAPLSAQILALMLGTLVVAQVVTLFFTVLAPPSPAPQYRLRDVAASLRGETVRGQGARPLVRSVRSDPPSLNSTGWLVSERSRRELAGLLGTDEANVRLLFYSPLPFAGTDAGARAEAPRGPIRLGERVPALAWRAPSQPQGLIRAGFPMGPGGPGGGGMGGAMGMGGPPPPRMEPPRTEGAGGPPEGLGSGPGGGQPGQGARSGGGASHAWQEPVTGTRIIPRAPHPQPAPSSTQPSPQASGSQASGAPRVEPGGHGGPAPSGGSGGDHATGRPPQAGGSPGRGADGQAAGFPRAGSQGFGAQGSGPQGPGFQGQGSQGPGAQGPGAQGQGFGPAGQASGEPSPVHAGGPLLGGEPPRQPSVSPASPPVEATPTPAAPPREAHVLHAEPLSPRPVQLSAGAVQPPNLGLIAPAPLVAAQQADAAGWVVGTPQQAERGLFGLAPSPFVQGDFVAAVRTAPGRWVTVAPEPEPFPNAWQRRVLMWFVAAFAVVGPIGYIFARRLARPIDQFAAAAERLGRDPTAPLAPLKGPAEIGRAARAFNQMHNRLRRFVDDRTGMVGAISHDLRTPLSRMRFRLERAPPEVQAGMLHDIQQMEEMISSVLIFIRDAVEPSVRERIDLRSLVECVVDDAALVGGEAVLDPGEPLSVEVDSLGVQRVLTNLIDNALKYGERADVRLYRDGGDAVAEVVDHGPGLSPDELERVFLPFYRADQARGLNTGGIGLGLAVSRSIARAHGGDVLLASNDGAGLKAQLRLPLARQAA